MKKIKSSALFFKNNKRTLAFLAIIIILITISYYCFGGIKLLNDISIILAIPAFVMSFIVLNVLNITPKELERYHKAMSLKEKDREKIREDYTNFLEGESFHQVRNVLSNINIYIVRKISKQDINKSIINLCNQNFDKIIMFFTKTRKEILCGVVAIVSVEDGISIIDDTDYSSLKITVEDLDQIDKLLKSLTSDMFVSDDLDDCTLDTLIEIFDENDGLFTKYWEINKTYMKSIKMEINEEGDLSD